MAHYNRILCFVVVIAVFVSLMAVSVSATEFDNTDSVIETISDEEVMVEEDIPEDDLTAPTVDLTEVNTHLENVEEDLTEANIYLKYITSFLLFFVIVILLYFTYKFFAMFF